MKLDTFKNIIEGMDDSEVKEATLFFTKQDLMLLHATIHDLKIYENKLKEVTEHQSSGKSDGDTMSIAMEVLADHKDKASMLSSVIFDKIDFKPTNSTSTL